MSFPSVPAPERPFGLVVTALALLLWPAGRVAAASPSAPPLAYTYDVTWVEGEAPALRVVWSAMAPSAASAPASVARVARVPPGKPTRLRLCLMMMRTGRFLDEPSAGDAASPRRMKVADDDPECFEARLPAGAPLTARYTVRLGEMASTLRDLDSATSVPGGFVFSDKAVLLRPDPTVDEGHASIRVRLPGALSMAAPWGTDPPRTGQPSEGDTQLSWRFVLDVDALDHGGYVGVGRVRPLPDIVLPGGVMAPALFDVPHRASDEDLLAWVGSASAMTADFYRGLPQPRIVVLLVPTSGESDGSVFGTVMRKSPTPSVVLLFGALATGAAFEDDWMAPHEIFHVGNPTNTGRFPWFIEGVTTYYQDVIRARAKPARARAMWTDLVHEFGRHCDGEMSLGEESRRMYELHHWTRVYWGGACLAFLADVAIRRRTWEPATHQSRESLDSVLRALLAASRSAPLDEAQVIAAIDRAVGRPLARERLRGRSRAPLAETWRQLGIEPTTDSVKLHDDAPLAELRKAIF